MGLLKINYKLKYKIMTTEYKVIGGIGLLTLIIIVGGVWLSDKSGIENRGRLSKSMIGEKIADLGAQHIARGKDHIPYNSNPPTSGPHYGDGVAGPGIKSTRS